MKTTNHITTFWKTAHWTIATYRVVVVFAISIVLVTAFVFSSQTPRSSGAENFGTIESAIENAMGVDVAWSGGDNNNSEWTTNSNWEGIGGAQPGDRLRFPEGATRRTNTNNFPVNTSFHSVALSGTNYVISGNQIILTHSLVGNGNFPTGNDSIFNPNIIMGDDILIASSGAGARNFVLNGVVNLNGHQLTLRSATSFVMNGLINGTGTIIKDGPGLTTLAGNSPSFGNTTISEGNLRINGTVGNVKLDGGNLQGNGTVGGIDANCPGCNGTIAPGIGGTTTSILESNQSVSLSVPVTLAVDINGTNVGSQYDRLAVAGGGVSLAGANLNVSLGFVPSPGQTFTIISHTGSGIVSGQFAQGTSITVGSQRFTISYSNSGVVLTAVAPEKTLFDYDGDGKSDVSIFRPSNGDWYIQRSQAGLLGKRFGVSTDRIAPADYDGDGKTDIAVYRPSAGTWFIVNSGNSTVTFPVFGVAEDLPTPADYDGDNKADIGVFRPSVGTWFRQNSANGSFFALQFGANGDKPTIGDFDGDAKADIGIWRPSIGDWYHIRSSNGSIFGERFGISTDKMVPADYDGDGKTDIAVYRPSTGHWFIRRSATGTYTASIFGLANDIPAPGDYDGDGKADICVFRPSEGNWFRQNSGNGSFFGFTFGFNGDLPTPSAFN